MHHPLDPHLKARLKLGRLDGEGVAASSAPHASERMWEGGAGSVLQLIQGFRKILLAANFYLSKDDVAMVFHVSCVNGRIHDLLPNQGVWLPRKG